MPPFVAVEIPLLSPSIPRSGSILGKGKASVQKVQKRRVYNDEPLPIRPSQDAPRQARIIGRIINYEGAFYQLKIGEVDINDVSVDEVLEYVSVQELEEYENKQFEEEREILRIEEKEEERIEKERAEQRKQRAKRKGTVIYQDLDESHDTGVDEGSLVLGAHGRARPTYKHLFKPVLEHRRRRRRDPVTGELMPLSEDGNEGIDTVNNSQGSSSDELLSRPAPGQGSLAHPELHKRRRRRRDSQTGELLPLPPLPSEAHPIHQDHRKRPRRRRHPLTGNLMPLGWRYDPMAPEERARSTSSRSIEMHTISPSLHRLSLSQEHSPKRVKVQSYRSPSVEFVSASVVVPQSPGSVARGNYSHPPTTTATALLPSAVESSPEPNHMTTFLRTPAMRVTEDESEEGEEEEGLDEGEYFVEKILGHAMSDSRTHRPEYGNEPVMLYHVKWEDSDDLTWEPRESFPDSSIVEDYRRRAGMISNYFKAPARGVNYDESDEDDDDEKEEAKMLLMEFKNGPQRRATGSIPIANTPSRSINS